MIMCLVFCSSVSYIINLKNMLTLSVEFVIVLRVAGGKKVGDRKVLDKFLRICYSVKSRRKKHLRFTVNKEYVEDDNLTWNF